MPLILLGVGDVVATPLLTDAGKNDGEPNEMGGEASPAAADAAPTVLVGTFCHGPFRGWCLCGTPTPLVAGLYVNADMDRC